ncbi:MAG: 4Fe-4S binding protein [Deltaproteobacteria bacterium]|nr:4Fe-4S binding protein [Deltaproteobacteria bacterium]MBI3077916.1 4Fe-4S binding protein [Deltaproteobacteria bacterium]
MVNPEPLGWRRIPEGALILEPGNAVQYLTGGWRTFRPVLDRERCTDCLICWIFCPDSAIQVKGGRLLGFDLEHCKGCGICAAVCPPSARAIAMVEESAFQDRAEP